MLTSKQRAYLKKLAHGIPSIFQIGKAGVTPELIKAILSSFEGRELIKCTVLNNCTEDIKYISSAISERTKSHVVQIIGKKIVLYKPFKENRVIILPK